MTSNLVSQLQKLLQYLFNLLHSFGHYVLHILHRIAPHVLPSWPARTKKPQPAPISAPTALRSTRPHALTAPSSPCTTSYSSPTTSSQLQSPFFNLPLEIRRLIYRHALISDVTHIVWIRTRRTRLTHVRCRDPDEERPWLHRCWGMAVKESGDIYSGRYKHLFNDVDDGNRKNHQSILPLLMTCRQIYTEAVSVVYRDTTFSMLQFESMLNFVTATLPQRLNTIRSVEWSCKLFFPYVDHTPTAAAYTIRSDDRWDVVWSIFAEMEGLTKLLVDLMKSSYENLPADEERLLLEPAMKVKRPRVWSLRLGWQGPGFDWDAAGAPFKVVRAELFAQRHSEDERDWFRFG